MKKKMISAVVCALLVAVAHAQGTDAYIESAGVAGIDTGYRMKPNSRIAVDFALTTTEQRAGARLFGVDYNTTALKIALGFYIGADNNNPCWVIGFGDSVTGWHAGWAQDDDGNYLHIDTGRHVAEYDFPRGRHTYYTDGKAIGWWTDAPDKYTEEATGSVTVFSTKNSSGVERPVKARIYGVKIYEKVDGEYVLVRDFKPCVATGRMGMPAEVAVAGFKCAVTGGFIGSATKYATFTASENTPVEVESPAYVSTGAAADNEYIDTGYVPTDKTRCEIDYSLNAVPSKSGWLFSAAGAGTYYYGVYVRGGYPGNYYVHNGTGWHQPIASDVAHDIDIPRTVVLDYPENKFLVYSGSITNTYPETAYAVSGKTYTGSLKLGTKWDASGEFASLKIFGFRIYEDGKLVRNFVPCKMDGVVGLRDLETGLFVGCAKPLGALDAGGDIEVKMNPYIETALEKMQYLNTGHIPTVNTRFEVDYALASDYTSGTWNIFRGKLDSDDYFTCYHNQNGFGAKNASGWPGAIKDFANVAKIRRTAILDNYLDTGALVTAGVTNYSVSTANPTSLSGDGVAIKLSSTQAGGEYGSLRIYSCRIFEANKLVHEYFPSVKADGGVGLQDTQSDKFLPVLSNSSSNPQVFGGAFVPAVTPSSSKITVGKSIILSATAPGAKSYRWLKNGSPIVGGEGSTLEIAWKKGYALDSYQAISVIEVDGVKVESEPSKTVMVENLRAGTMVSIR